MFRRINCCTSFLKTITATLLPIIFVSPLSIPHTTILDVIEAMDILFFLFSSQQRSNEKIEFLQENRNIASFLINHHP